MIVLPFLKNKTVYVVGLGKTGSASIASLLDSQAVVLAWDDSPDKVAAAKNIFNDVNFCAPELVDKDKLDYVLMSPGVPASHAAFGFNKPIISDIELLYKACPDACYIGITGTNGKSTTTALVGHILRGAGENAQIGGNIGVPVLSLDSSTPAVFVIELSSFQLALLKEVKFDIPVFLNLTPDHLDVHGSMEEYFKSKAKIFINQTAQCNAILSLDCLHLQGLDLKSKVRHFSVFGPADVYVKERVLYDSINGLSFDLNSMVTLPGRHNEENIAASYLACLMYGIKPDVIVEHIKSFAGLPHRIENVGVFGGCVFVNDSKATNAEAVEKALLCYEDIIWIAGGIAKDGGIEVLKKHFWRIKKAFLIGDAQEEFANTLEVSGCGYEKCGTLENALRKIKQEKLNGTVLLSPACASYDQFKNFEHRGEEFCKLVKEIF